MLKHEHTDNQASDTAELCCIRRGEKGNQAGFLDLFPDRVDPRRLNSFHFSRVNAASRREHIESGGNIYLFIIYTCFFSLSPLADFRMVNITI